MKYIYLANYIETSKSPLYMAQGQLSMIATCPPTEAVEYLRIELAKYERKCRDIEVGTSILMGKETKSLDILTKDSTPIEFRKFQRDFLVYYKESYMDKASPEGQKHYLLKCIDAELGERLLALTDASTPIFDIPNNPTKSVMTHLIEEFNRRFQATNRRKDFFLQ